MKKLFAMAGFYLLTATAVHAQITAEDSVKLIVGKLISSIRNSDGLGYGKCFTKEAKIETLQLDPKGNTIIKAQSLLDFANTLANMPKGMLEEKINFDVVKIDGAMAIVWASYKFYANNQLMYCGANLFQFIRSNGSWAINYHMDTRRTKCD